MTLPEDSQAAAAGALVLDAEALYDQLRGAAGRMVSAGTRLAGVASGGVWLARRLQRDLGLAGEAGTLSSALHRDDFARRGLASSAQTALPFEVEGADILLLDDVLYTGRTLRAVVNELFDYGRPQRVRLAVLVDRGARELPVAADYAAARVTLPRAQTLALQCAADGRLRFQFEPARAA